VMKWGAEVHFTEGKRTQDSKGHRQTIGDGCWLK